MGSVQRRVPTPAALGRAPVDDDRRQEGDEAAPPPVPATTGQRLWTGQHTQVHHHKVTRGKVSKHFKPFLFSDTFIFVNVFVDISQCIYLLMYFNVFVHVS